MSSTTIPTPGPGQGEDGEGPDFSIIIIAVPASAILLTLLMYTLARCWYPERFGFWRRSSQSDTAPSNNIQQDKPPSYEEILRDDNLTDLPTYSESLEQLANLTFSPSIHSNEETSTCNDNNSPEVTPPSPISIIFTNEIMQTEPEIDTYA